MLFCFSRFRSLLGLDYFCTLKINKTKHKTTLQTMNKSTVAGNKRDTKKRHNSQKYKDDINSKRKTIIVITTLLIFFAILTIAIFLSHGYSRVSISEMRYFARKSCDEENPTPIHINECKKATCMFDILSCPFPCPFGFQSDLRGCEISCDCASEGNFQGDVHFDENTVVRFAKDFGFTEEESFQVYAADMSAPLWNDKPKNGRHEIAYTLGKKLIKSFIPIIKTAIREYKEMTCIDFVPRTNQKEYIVITSEPGCWSFLGKLPDPGQTVSIGKGCNAIGIVEHELLHLLSFHHEHSRADRDAYITVHKENIIEGKEFAFARLIAQDYYDFDSKYDLGSLMQYPGTGFSKNGKPTIVEKATGDIVKGQRVTFSKEDLYEVNTLYGCNEDKGEEEVAWNKWGEWSSCDKTCGSGNKQRFRKCKDKSGNPVTGCAGNNSERTDCSSATCIATGVWNKWTDFEPCSRSCGNGIKWRRRVCSLRGECIGKATEGKTCHERICSKSVSSSWTRWSLWSACSKSCAEGKKDRVRGCLNSKNKLVSNCKGSNVHGKEIQLKVCNTVPCDQATTVIGNEWEHWSRCSSTCSGKRTRKKTCHMTGSCSDDETEIEDCNIRSCVSPGTLSWAQWSQWSTCSESCGGGTLDRVRVCVSPEMKPVKGCIGGDASSKQYEVKFCHPDPCAKPTTQVAGEWGHWSSCSSTCSGKRTRQILCDISDSCLDDATEVEDCNIEACLSKGTSFFMVPSVSQPQVLCSENAVTEWHFGDFNGDKRIDVMCLNSEGSKIGLADDKGVVSTLHWEGTLLGCIGSIYVTDLNGDGKDDLLCKDVTSQTLRMKLVNEAGEFDQKFFYGGTFCTERQDVLIPSDINGDGKADIVCHVYEHKTIIRLNHFKT